MGVTTEILTSDLGNITLEEENLVEGMMWVLEGASQGGERVVMDINVTHLDLPFVTDLKTTQSGLNFTDGDFLLIGAGKTDRQEKGREIM